MYYAGEVGKRFPVPLFQSFEDFIAFLIVLRVGRYFREHGFRDGTTVAFGLVLWSIERFFDEYLWLAVPRLWDAVEVFSLITLAVSLGALGWLIARHRQDVRGQTPPHTEQGFSPSLTEAEPRS
jgi:prolipoprotein diacylglyceryltransferase